MFLFGNVNFSVCESFKLERFTDRSEWRCLTPRMKMDEEKTFPVHPEMKHGTKNNHVFFRSKWVIFR